MSRTQDQVELEEEAVSGIGEADEVMDEVEEGYSESYARHDHSTHFTHHTALTSIFYAYFHAHVDQLVLFFARSRVLLRSVGGLYRR